MSGRELVYRQTISTRGCASAATLPNVRAFSRATVTGTMLSRCAVGANITFATTAEESLTVRRGGVVARRPLPCVSE